MALCVRSAGPGARRTSWLLVALAADKLAGKEPKADRQHFRSVGEASADIAQSVF